jgi:WD40 repeat protein
MRMWRESQQMRPEEFNPLVMVYAAAVSANTDLVATFSRDRMMLWDLSKKQEKYPHPEESFPNVVANCRLQLSYDRNDYRNSIASALFSPGNDFLLTTQDKSSDIVIWDKQGRPLGRLVGHTGPVGEIMFAGDKLISASEDATLLVWDWPKIAQWLRDRASQN